MSPVSQVTGRTSGRGTTIILIGVMAAALLLRMHFLGKWTFEGDEIFTLRDSLDLRPGNPRPLIYWLNHYLVLPFRPLDEFGLRLLPAIFGALAIPTLYIVGRLLVGSRAALIAASLLAVSGLHVYHSQYARYWSLVFLLATIYPFAIYFGIRQRNWTLLVVGLVAGALAALSHPTALLLLGGLGLWVVMTQWRRDTLARLWTQPAGRWTLIAIGLVAVGIAIRYVPVLYDWIAARDATPPNAGEHLLHLPKGTGIKQAAFLLSYVEGITFPLAITGALGIYLLWLKGDRQLALLLGSLAAFPVLFLATLSLRTAVSTSYLLATTPAFFLGAGVFVDWLAGLDRTLRPRWLLPVALVTLIALPGLPTLLSQYRDGRRYDFRGAAQWLGTQAAADDLIFSDQFQVVDHYLPDHEVERLSGDSLELAEATQMQRPEGHAVWIVAPGASHSFRTNPKLSDMMTWIYQHCQLRKTVGVARLDFRQNQLQIYRCPATAALPAAATSE